ncbi:MAG: MFS transporter [Clostridia bacterium]|nr:MFS transporter [Clostridia bacterium]
MASVSLAETGITADQIGFLGTVFSVVYAISRFLSGSVADKMHPAIPVVAGLAASGLSNMLFSFLPPVAVLLFLWAVNAFGQALLWGNLLRVVSAVYKPEKAGKMTSLLGTSVGFGNVVAIIAVAYLCDNAGVKYAFFIPALLLLVMGALAVLTLSKVPVPLMTEKSSVSFFSLLRNKKVRQSILPVSMQGMVKDSVSLLMALYFTETYGIDLKSIALFAVFIPLLGLFGRLIYPLVYGWVGQKEHTVTVCCYAVASVSALPLCWGEALPAVGAVACLSVIYAALSMVNTSFLSIFPLQFAENGQIASVSGIMDLAAYLANGIASAVYGTVVVSFGYLPMMISFVVLSFAGLLFTLPLMKNVQKGKGCA